MVRAGRHELLASPHVIEEARRNLATECLPDLEALVQGLTVVPSAPADLACPIELPAGDREALLAAIAAGASHFITGDIKHFGRYSGKRVARIPIQAPGDYLAAIRV
jgi:hypothetical protein